MGRQINVPACEQGICKVRNYVFFEKTAPAEAISDAPAGA